MKEEFNIISNLIEENTRVLDVGCGNGDLMKFLQENKTKDIRGAESDLKQFPKSSFDYVILSQTLQAFLNPELVINELLKVGKKVIVTIPNFGYWRVRLQLLFKGTMPVTENLPHEWYNTPNLHMCTIKDFYNFCSSKNIKIFKSIALKKSRISEINKSNLNYKNLDSHLGIFLIES